MSISPPGDDSHNVLIAVAVAVCSGVAVALSRLGRWLRSRRQPRAASGAGALATVGAPWVLCAADSNVCLEVGPAFARATGYHRAQLVGRSLDAVGIWSAEDYAALVAQVRQQGRAEAIAPWQRRDGQVQRGYLAAESVLWQEQPCLLVVLRDALEPNGDPLTDLATRTQFVERLRAALVDYQGNPERPFALLLLDVDRFKLVNDSLGHTLGDRLLQVIARQLRAAFAAEIPVARIGGDEFAVIVDEGDRARALDIAATLRQTLAGPYHLDNYTLRPRVSIGIAFADCAPTSVATLLGNADLALYRAKATRSRYAVVFEEAMRTDFSLRFRLESDLGPALQQEQFQVAYQPIVRLETGTLIGFEALARWRHPELGDIPPSEFIPVAEETGAIDQLGAWVLERACTDLQQWQPGPRQPLWTSVNLSNVQLARPELASRIAGILDRAGIPAERLHLEITESLFLDQPETAVATLHALRDLGIRVYLDDFGTGYSALSAIQQLPLDGLKIDRAFVADLDTTPRGYAIVQTIVQLARTLGIVAIAEGVETAEQARLLTEMGCHYGQGFYFAPGMSAREAAATIAFATLVPAARPRSL